MICFLNSSYQKPHGLEHWHHVVEHYHNRTNHDSKNHEKKNGPTSHVTSLHKDLYRKRLENIFLPETVRPKVWCEAMSSKPVLTKMALPEGSLIFCPKPQRLELWYFYFLFLLNAEEGYLSLNGVHHSPPIWVPHTGSLPLFFLYFILDLKCSLYQFCLWDVHVILTLAMIYLHTSWFFYLVVILFKYILFFLLFSES